MSGALALAPAQLVHVDGVLEPAQGDLSPIGEEELLASDDLADTFRDEYLAALSLGGDAGGEDDRRPEQISLLLDGLTGVEADADAERLGRRLVTRGERSLKGGCALQGARCGAEGGHEAVAHRLDLGAAVGRQGLAGQALVLAHQFAGAGVAEALSEGGGALDVGKQDGVDAAAHPFGLRRGSRLPALEQEVIDYFRCGFSIPPGRGQGGGPPHGGGGGPGP